MCPSNIKTLTFALCLNFKNKPLYDTTPIFPHCDTIHEWNIKGRPIFNPVKLENLL